MTVLWTGQTSCYDACGHVIPCAGSGQDAEFRRGLPWPVPRFEPAGGTVLDRLTGLVWLRDAGIGEFPMTWCEALDFIVRLNRECWCGFSDWRLPNRRELRSLISHQTRRPALPEDHPFINVFAGWYWTSTSAAIAPAHAWYVDLGGGRMFYGGKDQSFLVWPVRGQSRVLARTGQSRCYDDQGNPQDCRNTGQDGELRCGAPWPSPRFEARGETVLDRLTGLLWRREADLAGPLLWEEALTSVAELDRGANPGRWRLPNLNELESLVDAEAARPALPADHPFVHVRDVYWSSTTSLYQPDWAWALYLDKGAVGVGRKSEARFHLWAVCERHRAR